MEAFVDPLLHEIVMTESSPPQHTLKYKPVPKQGQYGNDSSIPITKPQCMGM